MSFAHLPGVGQSSKNYGKAVSGPRNIFVSIKTCHDGMKRCCVNLRKTKQISTGAQPPSQLLRKKKDGFKEETLTTSNQEFENIPIILERVARPDGT